MNTVYPPKRRRYSWVFSTFNMGKNMQQSTSTCIMLRACHINIFRWLRFGRIPYPTSPGYSRRCCSNHRVSCGRCCNRHFGSILSPSILSSSPRGVNKVSAFVFETRSCLHQGLAYDWPRSKIWLGRSFAVTNDRGAHELFAVTPVRSAPLCKMFCCLPLKYFRLPGYSQHSKK